MRVLNCLVLEHDYGLVLMAALVCLVGSLVTVRMMQRTLTENRQVRQHWRFLTAVTTGASIWATHFIAMMGYQPAVPVVLDGGLTVASAMIAVLGSWIAIAFATGSNRAIASVLGGAMFGLAMSAMHYVGMLAYRAEGIVHWLPEYATASLVLAMLISAFAVDRMRMAGEDHPYVAAGLLTGAIITLHFVGMAAFSVTPHAGIDGESPREAFVALAGAIALVAMMIVGMGISLQRVDLRTRARSEDKLRHIALHDSLTGLANRRRFNEKLQAECARQQGGSNQSFALLMIDLDRFKPVNDTLGHPAGDKVLKKVAARLQRAVREQDLVARIGGDEFAVIVPDITDAADVDHLAERIVELLCRPFVTDGELAELGASIGVALAPEDGSDADSLVVRADLALYTAKRNGRGQACRFDRNQSEAITARRSLEADLRRTCMREDFFLVYQPVQDTISGKFTGAEALIRWNCPKRGAVPPSTFVPIAEEIGLISRMGTAVLRQACSDAASWSNDYSVAVNLSRVQLLDTRLPQVVAQALADTGLPASRLELEITETALLDNDELALQLLTELRALGVNISLDDFGTGYSSLSYLHRFPIDRIKIDQSFVQRLPSDEGSASIVRAIAQLGCSFNLKITAEGIETDDQRLAIANLGCHALQGSLIGEPVLASEAADLFLKDNAKAAA